LEVLRYTSHGKGAVDGIGGSAKASVRSKVQTQGDNEIVVQNSEDFAKVAKEFMPNTTVFHINNNDALITNVNPWQNVQPIKGISLHVIEVSKNFQKCGTLTVHIL
jgi:hypothetical protein